jgi:hypothetical protein
MGFPRDKGEFYSDTDASDYQIGAVLSQMQDGQLKVISYESRLSNKAEKNYCVTDSQAIWPLPLGSFILNNHIKAW